MSMRFAVGLGLELVHDRGGETYKVKDAATVASWYYYRWRIESLHKIMKSAGWQLENWLQTSGEKILRKLLVGLAALAAVWALERRTDESSLAFQRLLMVLSGRRTKADRRITTTGLLAGLWVLQQSAAWLEDDGRGKSNALLDKHLPLFANIAKK